MRTTEQEINLIKRELTSIRRRLRDSYFIEGTERCTRLHLCCSECEALFGEIYVTDDDQAKMMGAATFCPKCTKEKGMEAK